MALPKKGTRRIMVNGTAYSWAVSPDSGYMKLVVEVANVPGQRLEAILEYHEYEETAHGPGKVVKRQRSIRPGTVRAIILAALGRGWEPAARGVFAFRDADRVLPIPAE